MQYEFFKYDPGDVYVDMWEADEEPEPIVADSWTRAGVPFKRLGQDYKRILAKPAHQEVAKQVAKKEAKQSPVVRLVAPREKAPSKVRTSNPATRRQSGMPEIKVKMAQEPAKKLIAESAEMLHAREIQDENKRVLSKIASLDRDGSKGYTYDSEGRIILHAAPPNVPFVAK